MNKKILTVAIVSMILQILLFILRIPGALFFVLLFYVFAIPFILYHLFHKKDPDSENKALNIIGVLLTFPLILTGAFIYHSYFTEYPEVEIDSSSIHVHGTDGREIPLDSLPALMKKDSSAFDRISIEDSIE